MKNIIIFLILVIIIGCSDKSTDLNEFFTLSGYVYYEKSPAHNVIVRVDENKSQTAATDQNGFFEINNIDAGNHSLNFYKELNENSFSEKTISIELDEDVSIDSLILPRGVRLLPPEDISINSLILRWTSTNAADFREYKIFRHISSGLDETTGTLIHVSTSIDDTTFNVIDLNPFNTYFFRVYVMNDYGKLGGSNIVSGTTQNLNLIENGSFENMDPYTSFAENWSINSVNDTYVAIDQTVSFEGSNSLHFYSLTEQYAFSSITIDIDPRYLIPGEMYELSFWAKHDSLAVYHTGWIDISPVSSHLYHIDGPKTSSGWIQHQKIFFTPVDGDYSSPKFQFHFAQIVDEAIQDLPLNVWIDNIELKRTN